MEIEKDKLIWMFRRMVMIRRFEETIAGFFTQGRLPGFLHASIGQEAVPVGTCANLRPDDYITSTHRGHGDVIAKGCRLDRMMAELYAKETGYCRGKGGSMHIADFSLGILGANGIVGAGLPIATGAALSAKMRGTDSIAVAFFGDGATNQGVFHEALNLAAVWDLPVVYVCQNNFYGQSTSQKYHQRIQHISTRAGSYGMPGVTVDGNDVVAVYEAVYEAVARARSGGGPSLVEAETYRHLGHYVGDPGAYRPAGEVEAWKARDPIALHRTRLRREGILTQEEAAAIEQEVEQELQAAVRFAEESPEPGLEVALEDVYA